MGDQLERARVADGRLRRGSKAAQEIGASGVQQVIAVELVTNDAERRFLERRLRDVQPTG